MSARHRQRGAAALVVALVLGLLALLTVAFTHRGVLFEHHSAVNQQHAMQASEAASAGMAWALAMMNRPVRVGSDCEPDPAGMPLRARQAVQAAQARALEAACTLGGGHRACHCPSSGPAQWPDGDADPASATRRFRVRLLPSTRPGQAEVTVQGCVGTAEACDHPDGDPAPRARAVAQATVAHLAALADVPAAALTVRGAADLRTSQWAVHQAPPPVGGFTTDAITVRSGAETRLGRAALHTADGTPALASLAEGDAALAALSPDGVFADLFRLGRGDWQRQPAVRRVDCPAAGACDAALAQALALAGETPMLWIAGPLRLDMAVAYGTDTRPVLWVVDGPVALNAAVAVHGLLYLRAPGWSDAAGAHIHGAVVAENDFRPTGATQLHHDPELLGRLARQAGTDAVVPGSWRDFISEDAP